MKATLIPRGGQILGEQVKMPAIWQSSDRLLCESAHSMARIRTAIHRSTNCSWAPGGGIAVRNSTVDVPIRTHLLSAHRFSAWFYGQIIPVLCRHITCKH